MVPEERRAGHGHGRGGGGSGQRCDPVPARRRGVRDREGSYAEYALAPEAKLALKPASLSFETAAAVAISGLTALQALRDHGNMQPGDKVLIIGASGGVADVPAAIGYVKDGRAQGKVVITV